MSVKLLSVNIEGNKHLDTVEDFLVRENADVVCLMEVRECDLTSLLGGYPDIVFAPNSRFRDGELQGVCIASRLPQLAKRVFVVDNLDLAIIPDYQEEVGVHRPVVQLSTIDDIQIGVTHFTWTPNMSETDIQKEHVVNLLDQLENQQLVLLGDFNIPRGNATYRKLVAKYLDNIPKRVTSTIDWEMHRAKRAGKEKFEAVVDYAWSTPKYKIGGVRVVSGVSDHCGVVCEVSKSDPA